jgi:hypothetical protein
MTTSVSNLGAATGSDISMASGHVLSHQGKVIQTVYVRTDTKGSYASNPSGDGTQITPLNLTITPTRADSIIWLRWVLFYESHQDTMFVVQQGSTLIGYNTYRGNVRWSGILAPLYDNDYSSTPNNNTINWFVPAGSTASRTYSLCTRSSSSGTYVVWLNRTYSSAGGDGHETGMSFGFAREISG